MSTGAPAQTANTAPSGEGIAAAPEHDELAMFDMDPGEFKTAPPVDGDSLAKDIDGVTAELRGDAPEQPSGDAEVAGSAKQSDAQPDELGDLRRQAASFGYAPEDVQSLDADTIRTLLDAQQDLTLYAGRNARQFAPPQIPPQPWAPQPTFPQVAPPGYGPQAQPQPFINVPVDEQTFDKPFVDFAQTLQAQANQQLAVMQQQIAAQQQHMQRQQAAFWQAQQEARDHAESRELDAWMDRQGDAFKPLFGDSTQVKQNSPQFQVRAAIFQQVQQLNAQAAAVGRQLDQGWVKEQAAKAVLGSKYDFFKQQAQRQPIQQRQKQMVGRANGMSPKSPAKSGREAAGDRADDFFRSRGLLG